MASFPFDFDAYSELSLQRLMVLDEARTDAFAAAIREVVEPGSTVIDVGAGTGLLSMLAARAGAKQVFGLERSGMAEVAKRLVETNELSETVTILRADASEFLAESPADLIVSEWLGHFAFAEGMLPHVFNCRDNNLADGGKLLPSAVDLRLAPLHAPALYKEQGPGGWKRSIHGIDYSLLEGLEVQQAVALKTTLKPEHLLAPAQNLLSLELGGATYEDIWASGELRFVASRDGQLHGFGGWFDAQLSPSVRLQTGPEVAATHWQQTVFSLTPFPVKEGAEIVVEYGLYEHPAISSALELELRVNGERHIFTVT